MRLVNVKITNFRCYNRTIEVPFENLTAFVGKNDIGKSTIMEALDIFFNDGKGVVKIDSSDVNIAARAAGNNEIQICCEFDELPETISIDATYQTTLESEYLLNADQHLEIVKKYKNGGAPKVFVRALHPTNANCCDLLTKKNAELKNIVETNHIECENKSINALLRRAIWEYNKDNLQVDSVEIDTTKEDAKMIWGSITGYLPVYSLFQSDRKNSDGDDEVQDPLKAAVKQILSEATIQDTLNRVANEVKRKLSDVADRTLAKLEEINPEIASSLSPVMLPTESLKWADVFKSVSIAGDGNIPINKRGSGVKRLILLSFFRAEAERRLTEENSTGVIYAVEEPETAQHTENQIILINAFKTLSISPNTQVIISTHSASIVRQLEFSNLRIIVNDNGERKAQCALREQLRYPSLNEVNYVAFNEVTEEYHNELFNFIEHQQWKNEYKQGKGQVEYLRMRDGELRTENKTMTEYIRDQIHHGDNTLNPRYTKEQLAESIGLMREFISNKMETGAYWEPDDL